MVLIKKRANKDRILYWIDYSCKETKEYYYKIRAYRMVDKTNYNSEYTNKYYAFRDL